MGEEGDEVSVACSITDQRTNYRVPHMITCLLLGVSFVWSYKWRDRALGPAASSGLLPTTDRLRNTIDCAVKVMFTKKRGLHGSPRLHADLRDDGGEIKREDSRGQGLMARRIKHRNGLTKQDKTTPEVPRPAQAGLHHRPAQRPPAVGV